LRDLAFIVGWAAIVPLALLGLPAALLLWTWSSLLAPNDVLYGLGQALPFSKLAVGIALLALVTGRPGSAQLHWNSTLLLLCAFAAVGLASQSSPLAVDTTDGWELFGRLLKILLLAGLVAAVMQDRLRLHALVLAICLGIGFTGAAEGAKFLLSGGANKALGAASKGDNNQVALQVLMILPLVRYLHQAAARSSLRIAYLVAGAFQVFCIIGSNSRAGVVGLAVFGVVVALGSKRKVAGLILVLVFTLVCSHLVSQAWVARMQTIESANDDESFVGRLGAWEVSMVIAGERPLLGGGFHAVQHADVWREHVAEAYRQKLFTNEPPTGPRAAHSIYFEVLGDLGFGGLSLFLLLLAAGWRNAAAVRRLVRRSGRPDLAWAASLASALQLSLLLFLVDGATLSAAYFDIDYLLVAMAAGLRGLVQREALTSAHQPDTRVVAGQDTVVTLQCRF
jgi:probable O-glycosylation ligase (exosortase A-associated)